MATDAKRVSGFNDGVTDRWYYPAPLDARARVNATATGDREVLYYALGNPQRTLRPNYDRRTEYPNLP